MDRSQRGGRLDSVPWWARGARRAFRAVVAAWAILYFAGGLIWISSKVFDYDLPTQTMSGELVFGFFVAFAAVAGVLWLIGEGLAGFRSDD